LASNGHLRVSISQAFFSMIRRTTGLNDPATRKKADLEVGFLRQAHA
jgi:hypothetical protein